MPINFQIKVMIALILSILFTTLLGIVFKLYGKYEIDIFQAIVFNYVTCVLVGWVDIGTFPLQMSSLEAPWFNWAILQGFLFIAGFNLAAQTVRYFGITAGAIMQKMSLGFTVVFSYLVMNEAMNIYKWLGVVAAILAIFFTNYPEKKEGQKSFAIDYKIAIPILTLVFATLIEIIFLIVEKRVATKSADPVFITTLFGTAAGIGLIGLSALTLAGKEKIKGKNIIAGIALGVPNYVAIYFTLKALGSGLDASVFFTLNNVGIIVLAAIFAVVFFKDRFSKPQYFGLGLSVLAILLIAFGATAF